MPAAVDQSFDSKRPTPNPERYGKPALDAGMRGLEQHHKERSDGIVRKNDSSTHKPKS
jgi:hypothetical protein